MIAAMLLLLSLVVPHAGTPELVEGPVTRAVRLVIVQPPNETVDAVAIQTAQQAVVDAAAFWHDRAPFVVDLALASTEVLTTEAEVYTDTAWSAGLASTDVSRVTIAVIDNRNSGKLLRGRQGGWAQPWNALAVAVLRHVVGQNALPAMIAHELGHVLFDLPDLYPILGACAHTDIMCYQVAAYNMPTIGCTSLATLGYPCQRVNMPLAMR